LALAGRLLERDPTIELCLTVRGQRKADATREALLAVAPRAKLSFVFVDLARPHDVLRAAAELRAKYDLTALHAAQPSCLKRLTRGNLVRAPRALS